MTRLINRHDTLRLASAALLLIGLALSGAAAGDVPAGPRDAALTWQVAQAQCTRRVGDYVTNDRAFAVRNQLLSQGYHAWIEAHGSLYAGTRTYVVFVAVC